MKINWKKVWRDLEKWIQEREASAERCNCCGRRNVMEVFPEWEEQQDKIQELVNQQVSQWESK